MWKPPRTSLVLALALGGALLSGCPKPSTRVTIGGHRLEPATNLFWTGTLGAVQTTKVIVSDVPLLCDLYETADPCTEAAQAATPGEGTYLTFTLSGEQAGEYTVAGKDSSHRAEVAFLVRSATQLEYQETALSGVVTVTSLVPGEGLGGRYKLTMSGGGTVEGEFGGDPCGKLDRLFQRLAESQPSCSWSFTPTACNAKCSCDTRVNSADCTRPDSTSDWECTCVRSGERSKCTVPKSEANVCTQGNGCCDTSF